MNSVSNLAVPDLDYSLAFLICVAKQTFEFVSAHYAMKCEPVSTCFLCVEVNIGDELNMIHAPRWGDAESTSWQLCFLSLFRDFGPWLNSDVVALPKTALLPCP
jgi:hypothetical protein